jgi:hypothetical protein
MRFGRMIVTAGGAAALAGMVALSGPAAWAQDATPEAADLFAPRPAHIHTGTCDEVGEVVGPLTDLTGGTGDRVGQARRAIPAESSFTSVPLTLDAILGADHVVNVHLSAEEIETYIACGEIGGSLSPEGAVIIGLREMNDSGTSRQERMALRPMSRPLLLQPSMRAGTAAVALRRRRRRRTGPQPRAALRWARLKPAHNGEERA